MSDHADVIREALWSLEGVFPGDYRLAALDALVAERDEAQRKAASYLAQLSDMDLLRAAAEARVTELFLEAAMRQILDGEDPIRIAREMDDARAALADKEGTP